MHKFFLSSLKKPKRKNGYDEKANASSEALAMNIDELVEGLERRRMTKQGDNGVMPSIDAKHVAVSSILPIGSICNFVQGLNGYIHVQFSYMNFGCKMK